MNFSKSTLWRTTILASVTAGVTAFSGAYAQTPSSAEQVPQADQTAGQSGDTVTVVGSRIRRDEFTSSSPVQVITQEESTLAGLASTTEILQSSSVTGGGAQINNYFGGFVTDGGPGANTLSLRGLGASRTLILLNGRRLAPAGTRGAVGSADLNVLPSAMVERIEILKDGASSIYGSDAVAGVVNIITERGLEGWNLEGQFNKTEHGGGDQYNGSVVGGVTGDTWEISGSLEYYERTNLTLNDRDWTQCNIDGLRNPATGASLDFVDPLTQYSKCYPITSTGSNGVTINTLGTPNVLFNTNGGIVFAPGNIPSCATTPALASCAYIINRWRPNSAVTTGLAGFEGVGGFNVNAAGTATVASNSNIRDTFDPRTLNRSLVSPAKTYTGYLQGSFDTTVLGNAETYFELLVSQRESSQTGYRQLTLDYPTFSLAANGSTDNPLIPANIEAIPGNFLAAGGSLLFAQPTKARAFIGFGNDRSSQSGIYYKFTGGLTGDFALPNWRYDAYASFSASDFDYTFESFLTNRVGASLLTNTAGTACANTAMAGCVVAPALNSQTLAGHLPDAWVNYVFQPVTGNTTYEEAVISAIIDGPIFTLPAGELQGAFGVEYRTAEIDDTPPIDSQTGNLYNLTSAAITRGDDSVAEVFGEIEAPLLRNMPFAHDLTLNVSARYTDYDSYGDDTTYKAGLIYAPVDWVTVRASYGTSYRAPALFEQFQGGTSGFIANTNDPCNNYGSLPTSSTRYINCHAELNNLSFISTQSVRVITAGGADQGLEAETSDNTSVGIVLQPSLPEAWGDFSFAVDWYSIEVNNQVERAGGASLLRLCYDDPQFRAGGGYCNFIDPRAVGTNALTVHDSYTNIATQIAEGYDYNFRWVKDIGEATFRANLELTQYTSQASKLFDTDPLDEYNGTLNTPEWTGLLDLQLDWKNWSAFYRATWIDEMDSYDLLGLDPATAPYDFAVGDYMLHNLSARYRSTNNWEFTVGVRNLFDKEPPFISMGFYNRVGNSPLYSGYDYFGRQYYVNVAKKF